MRARSSASGPARGWARSRSTSGGATRASPGGSRGGGSTRSRWARARKGIPIGAGDFGRVRSKPPRVSPPGDLDARRRPRPARHRHQRQPDPQQSRSLDPQPGTDGAGREPLLHRHQPVRRLVRERLNANARAVSDADIDQSLATSKPGEGEFVAIGCCPAAPSSTAAGRRTPTTHKGWIGGLSYCTRGGTGAEVLTVAYVSDAGAVPGVLRPRRQRLRNTHQQLPHAVPRLLQPQAQRDRPARSAPVTC